MFRAHVLIIRQSKLHYTASGIITPIGVYTEMRGQKNVKNYSVLLVVSCNPPVKADGLFSTQNIYVINLYNLLL